MFKIFVLLVSLLTAGLCQAQQKVPVQEGTEVGLSVAPNVLNRIAVENDRILTVKGLTGQFELDKDPELGQIFLKPIATDKQDLIHLFLTTENGHTYPLSLSLQAGPAQSILLMPVDPPPNSDPSKRGRGAWEQSSHYEGVLKTLVQALYNQTNVEGFVSDNAKLLKDALPNIKHAKVTQLQAYRGHKLQAHVLEVLNTGAEISPYFRKIFMNLVLERLLLSEQFYLSRLKPVFLL